ncbi:MAG: NAD(P)/FAD-dependent oxidoreductase [Alphaproteobacteria bacterium]
MSKVIVIGSGVIGLGCASYLTRFGHEVTLIDRVEPGRSTSYGNAGGIAGTFVAPLAMPGLMKKYIKYYLDPEGPVSFRWSHMPALLPFLYQFFRNCRPERVKECTAALAAFMPPAYEAWEPLFKDAGLMPLVRHNGGLWVYKDDATLDRDMPFWQSRRDAGLEFHRLSDDELRQSEPAVSRDWKAAVLEPDWHSVANPYDISAGLAQHLRARGATFVQAEVRGFEKSADGVSAVVTDRGNYAGDMILVAAGAWSHKLAAQLGSKVPLESQRGYHVTLPNAGLETRHLIVVGSAKIAISTLNIGVRIVGASAFPGVDAPADWSQAKMVLAWGKRVLPALNTEGMTEWFGERPLTPDSIPVMGRSPHHKNVFYAFGHSHMGLTTGGVTGRLMAQMMSGQQMPIDMNPYRIDRRY